MSIYVIIPSQLIVTIASVHYTTQLTRTRRIIVILLLHVTDTVLFGVRLWKTLRGAALILLINNSSQLMYLALSSHCVSVHKRQILDIFTHKQYTSRILNPYLMVSLACMFLHDS